MTYSGQEERELKAKVDNLEEKLAKNRSCHGSHGSGDGIILLTLAGGLSG